MAIDTKTKRKSAISVGKYGWRLLPEPDGTIGLEDRRQAVGHFWRMTGTPIGGPYDVAAGELYAAGGATGEAYQAGAAKSQIHAAGVAAGEVNT